MAGRLSKLQEFELPRRGSVGMSYIFEVWVLLSNPCVGRRQPPGDVCLAQRLALHWAVKAHPYARPYLAKAFLELQKATLDVKPCDDVGHEEEGFRSTLIS